MRSDLLGRHPMELPSNESETGVPPTPIFATSGALITSIYPSATTPRLALGSCCAKVALFPQVSLLFGGQCERGFVARRSLMLMQTAGRKSGNNGRGQLRPCVRANTLRAWIECGDT